MEEKCMKLKDQARRHYVRQQAPPEVKNEITFEDAEEMIANEEKAVEEAKEEEPNAEVVNVNFFLNVRSTPEVKEGNIVTMLQKGTKIIVIDKKPIPSKDGDFYKIKSLDPVLEGYAMKRYIKVY